MELLKVFDLEKYADHQASNLPYGQQRKLRDRKSTRYRSEAFCFWMSRQQV